MNCAWSAQGSGWQVYRVAGYGQLNSRAFEAVAEVPVPVIYSVLETRSPGSSSMGQIGNLTRYSSVRHFDFLLNIIAQDDMRGGHGGCLSLSLFVTNRVGSAGMGH